MEFTSNRLMGGADRRGRRKSSVHPLIVESFSRIERSSVRLPGRTPDAWSESSPFPHLEQYNLEYWTLHLELLPAKFSAFPRISDESHDLATDAIIDRDEAVHDTGFH